MTANHKTLPPDIDGYYKLWVVKHNYKVFMPGPLIQRSITKLDMLRVSFDFPPR